MKRFISLFFIATSGFIVSITLGYGLPANSEMHSEAFAIWQRADVVEDSVEAVLKNSPDPLLSADNPNSAAPNTPSNSDFEDGASGDGASEDGASEDGESGDGESGDGASEDGKPTDTTPHLSEVERIRRKLLIQGDSEYQAGNFTQAEALYRRAKDETWLLPHQFSERIPDPFSDEASLAPAAGVYWREAQAGMSKDRIAQTRVALALLTAEYPAFIPGHLQYAAILEASEDLDEATAVLEQALTIYPDQTDLLLAQVDLYMTREQWLEAAIASRQFVALNSDHAEAPAQAALASENLARFQRATRADIREDAIANAFTGIVGFAVTGNLFGPFTAASSAMMLLQGENAVGNQFANRIQQQLPMVEHPEANGYVRQLGHRLAAVTGRNDLDYEFFVILDPNLNAFALPGGKIFVNAGAILDTHSEAELAGLLAHELSHSVLSHGFQIAARGNLSSSLAQYLPYGGVINNVFLSGYSRQMERQADIVGTQVLAAGGYAADGLHNVMVTLNEQADGPRPPVWISSHPDPEDRVSYLKNLVDRGGYNRYAYEGVATHEEIQAIVARELAAYEAQQRLERGEVEEPTEEKPAEEGQEPTTAAPTAEEEPVDLYDAVERFDW